MPGLTRHPGRRSFIAWPSSAAGVSRQPVRAWRVHPPENALLCARRANAFSCGIFVALTTHRLVGNVFTERPNASGNATGSSLAASSTSTPVSQVDALGDFIDRNMPAWEQRQANYDNIVNAFSQHQGGDGTPGVLVAKARDSLHLSNATSSDDDAYYANIINALQARNAARQAAGASFRAGEARATDALYASGAGYVRDTSPVFSDAEIDGMRQINLARAQTLAGETQAELRSSSYETGIYSSDRGSIDYYRQRDGRVVVEITGARAPAEQKSAAAQIVGDMNERLNALVEDAQDHYVQNGAQGGGWNYALNAAGYVASEFFPRSVGQAALEAVGGPVMGKVVGVGVAQLNKFPVLGSTVTQLVRGLRSSSIENAPAGMLQTGARQVLNPGKIEGWDAAVPAYDAIRTNAADISAIAKNTAMPEATVARIKAHLFENEHLLDHGLRRFDADPDIVNSWSRLTRGDWVQSDLDLLAHERFESRFEALFGTNYRTAHDAAIRSGRTWTPE
jgi:hypothetical protein